MSLKTIILMWSESKAVTCYIDNQLHDHGAYIFLSSADGGFEPQLMVMILGL